MISMKEAFVDFFKRYAKFRGKSTRAAFWWIQLCIWIILLLLIIAATVAGCGGVQWLMWTLIAIMAFVGLAIIIPTISLTFRRYQDAGLSFDGALIFYVITFLLDMFSGINYFVRTLAILGVILSYVLYIIPSDFLVGKFGKLTRTK